MDIVHGYGLTAAVVDGGEGIARGWSSLPDIDMVRVNLGALTDPTILLGYPAGGAIQVIDGVEWPALEVVVLSADEATDLRRYAVPGSGGPRLVPAARPRAAAQARGGSPR